MCTHNDSFKLPCSHFTCKTCFFEQIRQTEYAKCEHCDEFDTKNLDRYVVTDDPCACYILGYMYERGKGVTRNRDEAIRLFLRASDFANSGLDTYWMLGISYFNHKKYVESMIWLTKSIEFSGIFGINDKEYQMIGRIYKIGNNGINKNYAESVKWFNKIKDEKFFVHVYKNLSEIYGEGGYGIEQDKEKSDEYYIKYAELSEQPYFKYYQKGQEFCDELNDDPKETIRWFEMAYNDIETRKVPYDTKLNDDTIGYYTVEKLRNGICEDIAEIYREGYSGMTVDIMEAYKWYDRASNLYMMGYIQYEAKNYTRAIEILRKLKEKRAYWLLGKIYCNGTDKLEPDYIEAFYWYNLGAKENEHDCCLALGDMYFEGKGCNKDYVEAGTYYKSLLENKYPHVRRQATYKLYKLYEKMKNIEQAEKYKLKYDLLETKANE